MKKGMDKLRQRREQVGMTQVELARRIGLSKQAVYRYEAGERTPNACILKALAAALECNMEDIV